MAILSNIQKGTITRQQMIELDEEKNCTKYRKTIKCAQNETMKEKN